MSSQLIDSLKHDCASEWAEYIHHEFPQRLADGTLAEEAFRHYLIQDYLFLKHFSRAWALAVYKAQDIASMRASAGVLDGLLNHEIKLHVAYCAAWGIPSEALERATEARANMAYTRYVLDAGLSGDQLDLLTALAPCVVGYAEIGSNCLSQTGDNLETHPFRQWIETYSGDEFQQLAGSVCEQMDALYATRGGTHRLPELRRIFRDATRLEHSFWDMGLQQSY